MSTFDVFDFSPLAKFTVGFDRAFNEISHAAHNISKANYPPYNVVKINDTEYQIEVAVSGFAENDLDVEYREGQLVVSGKKQDEAKIEYLHQGISNRDFVRHFILAENIQVKGATVKNGLLIIQLEKIIPEALRPRKIEIQSCPTKAIENKSK